MIIFEVISPITLPSLSSAAISRRSRAKKASCTSFGSAATPGDTAVAENDRIDWSRPPSSTIGSVGVNSLAETGFFSGLLQRSAARPAKRRHHQVRKLGVDRRAQGCMVSGKYLISFDLCPHRDCHASVCLQDAMHLSQRSWPVGEKL